MEFLLSQRAGIQKEVSSVIVILDTLLLIRTFVVILMNVLTMIISVIHLLIAEILMVVIPANVNLDMKVTVWSALMLMSVGEVIYLYAMMNMEFVPIMLVAMNVTVSMVILVMVYSVTTLMNVLMTVMNAQMLESVIILREAIIVVARMVSPGTESFVMMLMNVWV